MLDLGPRLEVTHTTGDMEEWEPSITIDTPRRISFRWSTGEQAYAAAEWQVGEEGAPAAASGAIGTGPFPPRTQHRFSIDFRPILAAQPPASPKRYWVRIAPLQARQARRRSCTPGREPRLCSGLTTSSSPRT